MDGYECLVRQGGLLFNKFNTESGEWQWPCPLDCPFWICPCNHYFRYMFSAVSCLSTWLKWVPKILVRSQWFLNLLPNQAWAAFLAEGSRTTHFWLGLLVLVGIGMTSSGQLWRSSRLAELAKKLAHLPLYRTCIHKVLLSVVLESSAKLSLGYQFGRRFKNH